MEKRWLIYKHTLKEGYEHSGWSYIGLTQQTINKRWKSGIGYKKQRFYDAIKKYGWENFSHEIIENNIVSELTGQGKIICIETGAVYYSHGDAYRQTGIRHILECCHGTRTVAGGYH